MKRPTLQGRKAIDRNGALNRGAQHGCSTASNLAVIENDPTDRSDLRQEVRRLPIRRLDMLRNQQDSQPCVRLDNARKRKNREKLVGL